MRQLFFQLKPFARPIPTHTAEIKFMLMTFNDTKTEGSSPGAYGSGNVLAANCSLLQCRWYNNQSDDTKVRGLTSTTNGTSRKLWRYKIKCRQLLAIGCCTMQTNQDNDIKLVCLNPTSESCRLTKKCWQQIALCCSTISTTINPMVERAGV